jgi:hypothetical protein
MSVQFGPEWREFENRLLRTPQVTEASLRRAMTASLLLIEGDARRNVVQDTRRLAGSINHRIDGTYPTLVGSVGPNVRYGAAVEFGRRAGAKMPPVDALIGWVRRHFNPAGFTGGAGPGRNRAWRSRERQLRSAAFLVARSIKRRADGGDRMAHPFMSPAYRRNQTRITQAFARVGAQVTTYLAGQRVA